MSAVKALPTTYAGVEFRSRIEARWALFFDKLGVAWTYEREGYELPSGNYLPDFWLPDVNDGCWFEVKGAEPTDRECRLRHELEEATDRWTFIAHGDMPRELSAYGQYGTDNYDERLFDITCGDSHYAWCICATCGKAGLQFEARSERICHHIGNHSCDLPEWADDGQYRGHCHGDKWYSGDHPRIIAAYQAARTHQFWKPGVT